MLCGVVYLDIMCAVPCDLSLMLFVAVIAQVHIFYLALHSNLDGVCCLDRMQSCPAFAPTML